MPSRAGVLAFSSPKAESIVNASSKVAVASSACVSSSMHAIARLRGSAPGDSSNAGEEIGGGTAMLSSGSVRRGGARGGEGGEWFTASFRGSERKGWLPGGSRGAEGWATEKGARGAGARGAGETSGSTKLDRCNGSGDGNEGGSRPAVESAPSWQPATIPAARA